MMSQLLGWLHLSDVHFGDGSHKHRLDKDQVLERLLEDVEFLVTQDAIGVDYVLVTGDLTFSGGGRSLDEFTLARSWLKKVLRVVGLDESRLLMIPGNHDADLSNDDGDDLKYVLQQLRLGSEAIDNVSTRVQESLLSRFDGFRDFSSAYGGDTAELGSAAHWWREVQPELAPSLTVAFAGLNTAMLTRERDNDAKLQLGQSPLAAWEHFEARRKILIALTHHPLTSEWIQDYEAVHQRFVQRVDIHLCGHVHGAEIELLRRGEMKPMLTVTSGAVHGAEGEPAGYGYSVGSLVAQDGEALVRIWPRYFYERKQEFDRHSDLLPRGRDYTEHPLGGKAKELVGELSATDAMSLVGPPEVTVRARADELKQLLERIDNVDLLRFASESLAEVQAEIRRLALMRHTPDLTAGAYYAFLLPYLESRPPGSRMWAISTMMAVEWTEDAYETRFLRANLDAAARGVAVERIFVVPAAEVGQLSTVEPIRRQIADPSLVTMLVVRERLAESDVALLERVGPGIIAFDEDLVLVDRHNEDGRARGYGTFMPEEVTTWRRTYLQLREHAQQLNIA